MPDGLFPPIRLSVITAKVPPRLTKSFRLAADGSLIKEPGGQLVDGHVDVRELRSLADLADLIVELRGAQALCYGLPPENASGIVTKKAWNAAGRPAHLTPRTNDRFSWPGGPGVMMLDHDPLQGDAPLDRDALVELIRSAAPGLAETSMLWVPSASSHIIDELGSNRTGLRGQRIYLIVADASDIPRAGKALIDRLWAACHGRIVVSRSGAMLERTLVDASVWQPSRLDFAAGADCDPPLRQERGDPVQINGRAEIVDTRVALPDPDAATADRADKARSEAREAVKPEAGAAREGWIAERVAHGMRHANSADNDPRQMLEACARQAIEGGVLAGEFELEVESGDEYVRLSVGELLDSRARWHGALTRDPLEPEYDGGRTVGRLYLLSASPTLHSFAHGGRTYRLIRAPARLQIVGGRTSELTDNVLERLSADPLTFDHGGAIATVHDGRVFHLDEASLSHHLGGIVQFFAVSKKKNEVVEHLKDPPLPVVRQALSLGERRQLKPLVAVITAPVLRRDGSVLDRPGYDVASGLFLDPRGAELPPIPEAPSRAEAAAAFDELWAPFSHFPFVDAAARGGLLAGVITAILRPVLPTSPGFAFDAPVQGSGKTLLAKCVGALAEGGAPDIWPHTVSRDDEEVRKRLFTALRSGSATIIWDNVTGTFDSASMAAMLTTEHMADRILGRSEGLKLPNRAILVLTGNNLTLSGDLPRRVLVCRIDPGTEAPHTRRFDTDPLTMVLQNRMAMVAAGLTLVRGYLASGAQSAPGRMASFELWDDLVRQAVCWVGTVLRPGQFDDPAKLVEQAQCADPEREALEDLLCLLERRFGGRWFETREVVDAAQGDGSNQLRAALLDLAGGKTELTSKTVGRLLSYRSERIVGGRRLRKTHHGNRSAWRVEALPEAKTSV